MSSDSSQSTKNPIKQDSIGGIIPSVPWGVGSVIWVSLLAFLGVQLLLGVFIGILVAALSKDPNEFLDSISTNILLTFGLTVISSAIGAAIILGFVKSKKGLKLLGYKWTSWSDTLTAIPGYGVYFVALLAINIAVASLVPEIDLNQQQELGFENVQGAGLVLAFFVLVVVAPFFEELLFRAFAFRSIASKYGYWPAAIVTSAVFGFAHGQWNVGIDTFILGLVACRLVWNTNSIWPAIMLHVIKNFVAFLFIFIIEIPNNVL
jgi:membrane protease YdiL (CAAX protease family)